MFKLIASLIALALATLALLSGPTAAQPTPPSPPNASATSVPTTWFIGTDGSVSILFSAADTDPVLLAQLTDAATAPDVRWLFDPDHGISQIGQKLDPSIGSK